MGCLEIETNIDCEVAKKVSQSASDLDTQNIPSKGNPSFLWGTPSEKFRGCRNMPHNSEILVILDGAF